ncbi:MAG: class I SAM-dependent methyltransferase [Rhodoglobus sp.]
MTFSLDDLRRWPDLEAPELRAWDAADTLILDEAAALLPGRDVVVIGDDYGALTLGSLAAGASNVRVHQDPLSAELALEANFREVATSAGVGAQTSAEVATSAKYVSLGLDAALVDGATLVLLRLPRSLDALDEIAALIAEHASSDVVVIAGGRLKHMTVSMNEVLSRHFGRLDVSLARQKSRLLIAREPFSGNTRRHRPIADGDEYFLKKEWHERLGLTAVARGGVFAGTSLDIGTRALVDVLDRLPSYASAIDLGCGTGILAARLKQLNPNAAVLASDQSAAAAASARLTMLANELDVRVTRDDALDAEPDASADLILLNPPFHTGATVHKGLAEKLFRASARVLRPGGELWTVWNSHLAYRPQLERIVGETRQIARGPKFTVTASVK